LPGLSLSVGPLTSFIDLRGTSWKGQFRHDGRHPPMVESSSSEFHRRTPPRRPAPHEPLGNAWISTGTSPLDRRPSIPIMVPLSLFSLRLLLPVRPAFHVRRHGRRQDRLQWISSVPRGASRDRAEPDLRGRVAGRIPPSGVDGARARSAGPPIRRWESGRALTGGTGEPMLPVFSRFLEIPLTAPMSRSRVQCSKRGSGGLCLMPAQESRERLRHRPRRLPTSRLRRCPRGPGRGTGADAGPAARAHCFRAGAL
jgi:hypothetical protein